LPENEAIIGGDSDPKSRNNSIEEYKKLFSKIREEKKRKENKSD